MKSRALFPLLSLVLDVGSVARADGTGLEATLDEPIVTTAAQSAQKQSVAPATTVTITSDDIRRYVLHTLDEAINFLAAGMATSSTLMRSEIGARGVQIPGDYGNHVLLLINGHVVNEPWNGTAYFDRGAGIPMELVDHVEIIVGPGSVLYGSNAMLGVINVVTKSAKDYAGLHLIAEGSLLPALGANGGLRSPSFSSSYTHDVGTSYRLALGYGHELTLFGLRSEVTFQGEYFEQDGPGYSFGPQYYGNDAVTGRPRIFSTQSGTPPPGTWGGDARNDIYVQAPAGHLRFVIGDWELNVHANLFNRGDPYNTYNDFGNSSSHELDRFLTGDLKYKRAISKIADVSVRLYGDSYDYQWSALVPAAEQCLAGQTNGCLGREIGVSRWMGTEDQIALDYFNDGTLRTLVGVDARYRYIGTKTDYLDSVTLFNPGSVGAFQTTETMLALYGQQEYSPFPWLAFNAGARADFEEGFGHVTPRLAASVRPWGGAAVKLIYSEGFRAPSAYERFTADPTYQLATPNLQPEIERSIELSFEQRAGTHRFLFDAFRSWWQDLISLETLTGAQLDAAIARGALQPGTAVAYENQTIASIDSVGFQTTFEGSFGIDQLRYGINLTAAVSRLTAGDGAAETPIPVAPTLFGNARLAYTFGPELPTLALAGQLVGRRPVQNAFDAGTSRFSTPRPTRQGQATLSGPFSPLRGLSYRATVNYAAPAYSAYVAGPVLQATPAQPLREQVPNQRMQIWIGVDYVF